MTIVARNKTVTVKNKQVRDKFKKYVLNNIGTSEVKNFKKNFPFDWADSMYVSGSLDVYDYDLYCTLRELGVTTKPVLEFEKVLNTNCTYRHREQLRTEYVKLIYNSLKEV